MVFVGKNASRYGNIMMACGSFFLKAVTWSSSVACFMMCLFSRTSAPPHQVAARTHSSLCHSSHIPGFSWTCHSFIQMWHSKVISHLSQTQMFLGGSNLWEADTSAGLAKYWTLKIHKQMNFEGAEPFPYSGYGRKYLLSLCWSVSFYIKS